VPEQGGTSNPAKTIFRNAAAITAGTMALKALNFLFRIYVVRALGDELFGEYSIVIAFVGLFQILAEPGITQFAMREITRNRESGGDLFWNLVAVRLILALVSTVIITAAAYGFGYTPSIVLSIFLYTLTFVLSAFDVPMQTLIVAHERYDYISLLNIVGQVAFILLGTLVLLSGHGIVVLVAIGLLAMIPQMVLAARFIRQHGYLKGMPKITPGTWSALLRAGLPFGITTLALVIAQSIDTVMLSWFWPAQEVGWYNAAYRLAVSFIFLFEGINRALVPSLSRAFVTDKEYVRSWYFRAVRVIVMIGLPIAVGGMLVADPLIHLLFTDEFAPAIPAFQILVWDVPFILFAYFCGNMTTIVNKERVAARINTINAIANIVLNLIFIPRYGIIAAAVITVVTDILAALQFHFALSREMQLPNLMPMLLRLVIGAGVMGLAVFLASTMPLFVQIAVGVVTYALMVLAMKVLDETDWRMLRSTFERSRGMLAGVGTRKEAG